MPISFWETTSHLKHLYAFKLNFKSKFSFTSVLHAWISGGWVMIGDRCPFAWQHLSRAIIPLNKLYIVNQQSAFIFFWRVSSDTQSNVKFIADLRQQNCLVDNIFSIHVFGPVLFRFYQTSACTYSSSVKSILVQIVYYFPMAIFVIFPHCISIKDVQ